MPRKIPPADSDLLCETCGYIVTGLPADASCPECGTLIAESLPSRRKLTAFDRSSTSTQRTRHFFGTALTIIVAPERFYRRMAVREPGRSQAFAMRVGLINATLFSIAAVAHFSFLQKTFVLPIQSRVGLIPALFAVTFVGLLISLYWLYRLASRLTSFEGTYRGLRMPLPVVRRVMNFHQATLMVPALVAMLITLVPHFFRYAEWYSDERYLYTLSGVVVVGAVYLFTSYWGAMRRVMYANA